jgi:hypothetical protein
MTRCADPDLFDDDLREAQAYQQQLLERQQQEQRVRFRQTGGSSFTPMPEGAHAGVITGVIDLGKQAGVNRPGLVIKDAYKVALVVTFPEVKLESGEPMTVTKIETASMHAKSNMRAFIENLFGKAFPSQEAADDFDPKTLLGRAGLFNIVHKAQGDKTFANIKSVMALPKGMPKPQVDESSFLIFDPTTDGPEFAAAYQRLPEWLRKKFDARLPDEETTTDGAGAGGEESPFDDDIPF